MEGMITAVANITELLQQSAAGDGEATRLLMEEVYPHLRRIARNLLRSRSPVSIQITDVVHETYLKLMNQERVTWQNRAQFYAISARLMRRILVDHSRHVGRQKRGGDTVRVSLDEAVDVPTEPTIDVVELDRALDGLAEVDSTVARLVELRFFGGLTVDEAASVLGIGRTTAVRGWKYTRSWLYRELGGEMH